MGSEKLRTERDAALRDYADQMDQLAKFARADADEVRSGVAPDALAGLLLDRAMKTFYRWMKADKALRKAVEQQS